MIWYKREADQQSLKHLFCFISVPKDMLLVSATTKMITYMALNVDLWRALSLLRLLNISTFHRDCWYSKSQKHKVKIWPAFPLVYRQVFVFVFVNVCVIPAFSARGASWYWQRRALSLLKLLSNSVFRRDSWYAKSQTNKQATWKAMHSETN